MVFQRSRTGIRAVVPALLLLLTTACNSAPRSEDHADGWVGERTEQNSTLTVRTVSGSVWAGEGRLIEQTAIGTETRGEDDLLGTVEGMDFAADRIYILDSDYYTLRVYDFDGNHVMNIGRQGRGPGELAWPTDMGIDPVRRYLVVREGVMGILHRFTLEGEYVDTLRPGLRGGLSGSILLLRVTRSGVPIVPQFTHRRAPDTDLGYISTYVLYPVDQNGAITDTLQLPVYDHPSYVLTAVADNQGNYRPEPVPFGPQEVWSITWDGALITGYAGEYRFAIHYPDGRRTVIEREAEPVRVTPGEKEWHTRRVNAIMRHFRPGWAWNGPAIPDTKPWFVAIIPDRSGRLWVLRTGAGRPVEGWTEPDDWRGWERSRAWAEEAWFEVFEEESGRYLGRVPVPDNFASRPEPVIEDNTFICLTGDEMGRPIVRRYRLELPPPA